MNGEYDADEELDQEEDGPQYSPPGEIDVKELTDGLGRLTLLNDDPYLRMQGFNLAIVDQFIAGLEHAVLHKLNQEESTPIPEASFLSAQSQMWIFAVYELLRTWRQRAKEIVEWSKTGQLKKKLKEYERDLGYQNFSRDTRAGRLRKVIDNPALVENLKEDLRRIHIAFSRIEFVRIAIAKHEVRSRKKSVAYAPGYGRINNWCGSLDYELSDGRNIFGYINRRDIADSIRSFSSSDSPPSDHELKEFDECMRAPDSH
jgi:hypothetical protein